jgi:ParB-like chromosome segregation protein Spo0J
MLLAVAKLKMSNGDPLDLEKLAAVRERTLPLAGLVARCGGINIDTLAAKIASMERGAPCQPIKVRPEAGGSYRITDGHHRFVAALVLGLTHVPVVVQ